MCVFAYYLYTGFIFFLSPWNQCVEFMFPLPFCSLINSVGKVGLRDNNWPTSSNVFSEDRLDLASTFQVQHLNFMWLDWMWIFQIKTLNSRPSKDFFFKIKENTQHIMDFEYTYIIKMCTSTILTENCSCIKASIYKAERNIYGLLHVHIKILCEYFYISELFSVNLARVLQFF